MSVYTRAVNQNEAPYSSEREEGDAGLLRGVEGLNESAYRRDPHRKFTGKKIAARKKAATAP